MEEKKSFSVDEEVAVFVGGKLRAQGMVIEVMPHTGICEVVVNSVVHYFFLGTGQSLESDLAWIEQVSALPAINARAGKSITDAEIVDAFRAAQKACARDNLKGVAQIARKLCICDLSCQPTITESFAICDKAKRIHYILKGFAISRRSEPSSEEVVAVREYLK